MKKSLFVLFALVAAAVSAHATSPYYGPYAYLEVGGKPGCRVLPGQNLNSNYLESLIRAAAGAPLVITGAHMIEQNPAIVIQAGVFPKLSPFVVYKDQANISQRSGPEAAALVAIVKSKCFDKNNK